MRAGHVWLASSLLLPLVGAPLLKHRAFRFLGFPCRAVVAGGVGAVLLSWTMTVFALAGLRWGPLLLLVSAAFAFALRLVLPEDEEIIPSPRSRAEGPGEGRAPVSQLLACSITAISVFAAFAATAAARSTSPDLLFFWGAKAQQFAAARTVDVAFLSAPDLEYLHVYYPPLVTNVFAFGAMIAGRFPWGSATLTFPLLLAATSLGLAGIVKAGVPRAAAWATAALVASALALAGIHESVAGNAEPFLLFFEVLGVALLVTPPARSVAGQLLAGLLFAGAATTKIEGLPFVLAAVFLFIVLERRWTRPLARTVLLLLGPSIVALGSWFAFGLARKLFSGYAGYGKVLAVQWDNLPAVLAAVALALWKAGYALPWLVPLAVLLLLPGKTRHALLPAGVAAALAGFLLFTYLTTEGDPRLLIRWSAARVLSPVAALIALASLGARDRR